MTCTRSRFSGIGQRLVFAILISTVCVGLLPTSPASSETAGAEPFKIHELVFTDCRPNCNDGVVDGSNFNNYRVDAGRRLAIATSTQKIVTINVDTLQQTAAIDFTHLGLKGLNRRFTTAYDQRRGRLLVSEGMYCSDAACLSEPHRIAAIDVTGQSPASIFEFPGLGLENGYAGHAVQALGYDSRRDMVYAFTARKADATNGSASTIHAIRGSDMREGGKPLWSHPVSHCLTIAQGSQGVALAAARSGEFLYLACKTPQGGAAGGLAVPHGALRINLNSPDPSSHDQEAFTTEFFPFAGDMSLSFSFADTVSDRLSVVVTGGEGRLYVFDAAQRAWIGSVPLGENVNVFTGGVDKATGRAYLVDDKKGFSISDTNALPVLQGQSYPAPAGVGVGFGVSEVDPVTRRVFMPRSSGGWVFEDLTPPAPLKPLEDPDSATHDLDEELAVEVTHTGGASAYGARSLHVNPQQTAKGVISQLPPERQPNPGDRGFFMGHVSEAQLSGGLAGGQAAAAAVGMSVDAATAADLNALGFEEALRSELRELNESRCKDFGGEDDVTAAEGAGSSVTCSQGEMVEASARSSDDADTSSVHVGYAESHITTTKDPDLGIVTSSHAYARDVIVRTPAGSIEIGEARSEAKSLAHGRPGTAESLFETELTNVRLSDPTGKTAFSCGGEEEREDEPGYRPCDVREVLHAINSMFPFHVHAQGPRRDLNPLTTGSPGGAQALVVKDPYARQSDINVNGDSRNEVAALQLTIYNDQRTSSRLVLQLAAVMAESKYHIGAAAPEVDLGATSLSIELLDDLGAPLAGGVFAVAPDPTGGAVPDPVLETDPDTDSGTAEPMEDDKDTDTGADTESGGADTESEEANEGSELDTDTDTDTGPNETEPEDEIAGVDDVLNDTVADLTCVTAEDGIGDCVFDSIAPGAYIVSQVVAPAGFAAAPAFSVIVSPGFETKVTFTNLSSIGGITISLTDDNDPPAPLAGVEFVVYSDDGDLVLGDADVEYARCTTGDDGACAPFKDVPLGAYVVHQVSAPGELMPADDIGFALEQPGQVAALSFVNGLRGIEGSSGTSVSTEPADETALTFDEPPVLISRASPVPPPVATRTPIAKPSSAGGFGRVIGMPGDVLGFIARRPTESLLFAGVWLILLAPLYLAARRRSLILVKDVS